MNKLMQAGMAEATRLTRAGRLTEATAIIQRTLRNMSTTSVHQVEPDVLSPGSLQLPGIMSSSTRGMPILTPEPLSSPAHIGGQFVDGAYTSTAGTRAYKLYIPSGYTGQALPLIVMLHGCTQSPVDFATGTHMNLLAEDKMFFVAYPEQATSANASKCWNWFQASDQDRDSGEPSLIAGIAQQIMGTYHVDVNRVYVAGLSAGGAMAVILAATYPDLFAAVGVHSGLAYGSAYDLPSAFAAMKQGAFQQSRRLASAIPLIIFHGDRDTRVALANADSILNQWLDATEDGPGTMCRPQYAASIERGQVIGGHTYTRFIYQDASGQALVEKWVIHELGHAWSGGSSGGSFTDPKGPDASAEMARFFTEHPRTR